MIEGNLAISTGLILAVVALGVVLVWTFRRAPTPTADKLDQSYSAFTTEFDVVCSSIDLAGILAASGNNTQPSTGAGEFSPEQRRRTFLDAQDAGRELLASEELSDLSDASILIMLDQSGSMVNRVPQVAGELCVAMNLMEQSGARTQLVGFTTLGWRGGQSRENWLHAGKPSYPGRLCDLLYVTYSDFEHDTESKLLEDLIRPDIFFENVDGEALMWGRSQLHEEARPRRFLIIISDGAPVDDSTLQENGPSFLWRHLQSVIEKIGSDEQIVIGAVGIEHRVGSLYSQSRQADLPGELAPLLIDLVRDLERRSD